MRSYPTKSIFLIVFTLLFLSGNVKANASFSNLLPIYFTTSQKLTIPKLGVPSGDAGYAYQVEMSLFSNDPLGFIVTSMSEPIAITAEEDISAIYRSETHSIFFPRVNIIDENNNISEILNVTLTLSGDPFVWFYTPQ